MHIPGYTSASELLYELEAAIGSNSFELIGEFGPSFDALGFRLLERERYLFSISTHAGDLPHGLYDLQISIADGTLENGDIIFLADVDKKQFLSVVNGVRNGTIT
jgi:hypothetical protein